MILLYHPGIRHIRGSAVYENGLSRTDHRIRYYAYFESAVVLISVYEQAAESMSCVADFFLPVIKNGVVFMWDEYFKWFITDCFPESLQSDSWNYKDDLCLLGAARLYQITEKEYFRQIQMAAAHYLLKSDGCVVNWKDHEYNLDKISFAKSLLLLYELFADKKYLCAAEYARKTLDSYPRTATGNFWHKDIYPHQVWLDGLYMSLPFYAAWEAGYGSHEYTEIIHQFKEVRRLLWSDKKRLYLHAWDENRQALWADPVSGLSPCVWLRAEGWFLMALVDTYGILHGKTGEADVLAVLLREAAEGLLPYTDASSGMLLQLVDRADLSGNYPETSGTAMAVYSILKGVRLGMLPDTFIEPALNMWNALTHISLKKGLMGIHLTHICASAGLGPGPDNRTDRDGSPAYYLSEKQADDDRHGAGAAMLAYSEVLLHTEWNRL